MSIRDRKSTVRSLRTAAERGERGFLSPAIDQDSLTMVLLFTIAALSALSFMLRFPELGAAIAPLNQF